MPAGIDLAQDACVAVLEQHFKGICVSLLVSNAGMLSVDSLAEPNFADALQLVRRGHRVAEGRSERAVYCFSCSRTIQDEMQHHGHHMPQCIMASQVPLTH